MSVTIKKIRSMLKRLAILGVSILLRDIYIKEILM